MATRRTRLRQDIAATYAMTKEPVPATLERLFVMGRRGTFALGVKVWMR